MTSTQLQANIEPLSRKTKRFSKKKKSNNSLKLLSGASQPVESTTESKKRLRKTRRTPRKKQSKVESYSSSSSDSDTSEETVAPPRKRKRRTKKRTYERTVESLATVGRAYGNNVSKLNVSKVPERSQTVNKLNHSVSSKTAASREFGDFFSCKTGLTHLEAHRVDQINSKGIKRFTEEYLKKLKKCEEFESAHNVQPFASVRLELLNEGRGNNTGTDDQAAIRMKSDSVSNVEDAQDKADEPKALSVAALKTIELIKKFKSGQSIDADLLVAKQRKSDAVVDTENRSQQRIVRSGSNKSRSTSTEKNQNKMDATSGNDTKTPNSDEGKKINKIDKITDKSLEKFITAPDAAKKIDKKLQSIQEAPSDDLLSLGRNSTESFKSPEPKMDPHQKSISSRHGYVLMKKVLTSSENTVTIVDGKKRYDTKNQKVESHYSGRMPIKAGDDKVKSLNSIETLYRTDGANKSKNK